MSELIVVALDRSLITQVAAETKRGWTGMLSGRLGVFDRAAEILIRLMASEAQAGGISGLLYADHLTQALVLRRLSLEGNQGLDIPSREGLPSSSLRRVLDRMETNLRKDLDLQSLAAESGYSRNHFLRLFHSATGSAPHQHLLRLRINKAQTMIRNRSESLLDIALACGFSRHAHFREFSGEFLASLPANFDEACDSALPGSYF